MGIRIVFLAFLALLPAQEETIRVPSGSPPEIDGSISPEEWGDALRLPFSGGDAVFLKKSDGDLFIGVRGASGGFTSLGLAGPDSLRILHASTALITASYVRRGDQWERDRDFTGPLNGEGLPFQRPAVRWSRTYMDSKYEQFGWTANLVELGVSTDSEFRIRVPDDPGDPLFLCVVMFQAQAATRIARAPEHLSDASVSVDLIQGSAGSSLAFDTSEWIRVTW